MKKTLSFSLAAILLMAASGCCGEGRRHVSRHDHDRPQHKECAKAAAPAYVPPAPTPPPPAAATGSTTDCGVLIANVEPNIVFNLRNRVWPTKTVDTYDSQDVIVNRHLKVTVIEKRLKPDIVHTIEDQGCSQIEIKSAD